MGGGGRRSSSGSTKNSKGNSRPNPKHSSSSSGRRKNSSLFVEGGILSDFRLDSPSVTPAREGNSSGKRSNFGNSDRTKGSASNPGQKKLNANAVPYQYPSMSIQEGVDLESPTLGNDGYYKVQESNHTVLLDSRESKIVAYLDRKPSMMSEDVSYNYEYHPSFVLGDGSHRGLGFCDESDANASGIASSSKHIEEQEGSSFEPLSSDSDMDNEENNCESDVYASGKALSEKSSSQRNPGFLSIGGVKLFTEDISDKESDGGDDARSVEDKSSVSSEPVESSDTNSTSDIYDSDSGVDDEVAEDYLEGIGGRKNILKAKWLAGEALDVSSYCTSSSSTFDNTVKKLGGISLEEASKEYGMKKSRPVNRFFGDSKGAGSSALDDLMLVKDPRNLSKKKKKKHTARFPQSWPSVAVRSKNSGSFPGEKKKRRKEMIAVKRRERSGVDLGQINLTLEQIVLDGRDIHCFQPMRHRDCSQVRRLAAIYGLSIRCQGSGKKKFVAVTRTHRTSMPSASDKVRLDKLIGAGDEDADFAVNEGLQRPNNGRLKKMAQGRSGLDLQLSSGKSETSKRKQSGKKVPYANKPVPFVSSGLINSETVETRTNDDKEAKEERGSIDTSNSAQFGAFEVHTKGFGSKMMAKMGFVRGGLGKEGQGMAEPIKVVQRPKSLGLGLDFSEAVRDPSYESTETRRVKTSVKHAKGASSASGNSGLARAETKTLGAFEKHTKGFGSKMMAKMGFVDGRGLGKDSQGIVNPLVAVRRPKARGLGADV